MHGASGDVVSKVLLAVMVGMLAGCTHRGTEVARMPSPDGAVDAVLVASGDTAARASSFEVYVVPIGAGIAKTDSAVYLSGVVSAPGLPGPRLRWEAPATLVVEFRLATRVIVSRPQLYVGSRRVLVRLRSGVEAPPPPGQRLTPARGGSSPP